MCNFLTSIGSDPQLQGIGIITSVLSLVAAAIAAYLAKGAKKAAEDAKAALRQQQSPWRLEDIYEDVGLAEMALGSYHWTSFDAIIGVSRRRLRMNRSLLQAPSLLGGVDSADQALERASEYAAIARRQKEAAKKQIALRDALDAVQKARDAVKAVCDELRIAAGQV
jgi:hypothetical protein